ncbi:terminal uridylyltransferase 7-like [Tigriopus californicus]|uniref:terminal uridylyltransferase 7-like n=1 Tax=Tigriopus californicus TaxID=6832 RepID=UPI0027DA549A|nr:terminal uridylyltransferase 7-like [Tigriopus californicus]
MTGPSGSGSVKPRGAGKAPRRRGGVDELRDPELYHALMEECSKEEAMIRHGQVYGPSPLVTRFLALNDVRPLKKRSAKFPKAQFYCRLCDYHCDTLTICISHIKDTRHSRLAQMQEIETTLFHIPKPSKHHLDYLEGLLLNLERELGLSAVDLKHRAAVADQISAALAHINPQVSARLYGSSLSGFGLKNSVLNLDLVFPDTMKPAQALILTFEGLSGQPDVFQNVTKNFTCKMPSIQFVMDGFTCELSCNNHMAVQTSMLMRDYWSLDPRVRTLATAVRHWAQICQIDRQAEGTLPAHAFSILLVFFLQQETKPVLPCIHDFLEARDVDAYTSPEDELRAWKTRNSKTVAELLIEFFEFFALGFKMSEIVVSIRFIGGISKEDKQWRGKKLSIEDPFSIKRNLARSVNSLSILDFISECFNIAYLYFGTVQTSNGPVILKILVPDASPERKASPTGDNQANEVDEASSILPGILNQLQIAANEPKAGGNLERGDPSSALTVDALERKLLKGAAISGSGPQDEASDHSDSEGEMDSPDTLESFLSVYGRELTPKQAKVVTELVPKNMISFQFDWNILTRGQAPALVCNVCGNEGHLQNNCPEEQIPDPVELPPLPKQYVMEMDGLCKQVMHVYEPILPELRAREVIINDLSKYIQHTFPNAILTVFGSSCNGFAFTGSDLDISLTFRDHKTVEDLDTVSIMQTLFAKVSVMKGLRNVNAITTAKVPIIKFEHARSRLAGDISLYNVLAQENTAMLRCYSTIDSRVKILGYMVKLFARTCDIGDASRGSLSSYAYILMLLHYLQQVEPPVIPVLQELDGGATAHTNMVDGCNAWYFKDMMRLKQVWPGLGQNQTSVYYLWLGFLQYYAHDFNDKELVVCTRQKAPLTKFEKMWNSGCIAIEDPFDHSHNLGAGLSRKMNLYIKRAFGKGRLRFGLIPGSAPNLEPNQLRARPLEYFFNQACLTNGPLPNDRGCRMCGVIGHLVRDCPKKLLYEERRRKRKDNQRQQTNQAPHHERDSKTQRKPPTAHEPAVHTKQSPSPPTQAQPSEPVSAHPNQGPNLLNLLGITPTQSNDLPPKPSQPRSPSSPPGLPLVSGVLSVEQLERALHNSQPPPRPTLPPGYNEIRDPFEPPPFTGMPAPAGSPFPGHHMTRTIPPFGYPQQRFPGPVRGKMPPGFSPFPFLPPTPMIAPPGAYPHPPSPNEFVSFPRNMSEVHNRPGFSPTFGQVPPMRPFPAFPTYGGLSNPMMSQSRFQPPGHMSQNMFTQIQIPGSPRSTHANRGSPDFLGGLRQGSSELDHSPPTQRNLGPIMPPGSQGGLP